MAVCEHWNYRDEGKDFHGGYAFMSQGPLPRAWAQIVATARGLWGEALRQRDARLQPHRRLRAGGARPSRGRENRVDAGRRDRPATACASRA